MRPLAALSAAVLACTGAACAELDEGVLADAGVESAAPDGGLDAPDAAQPVDAATPDPVPDAGPLPPALLSVDPPTGGASIPTEVLLRGRGYPKSTPAVFVGGVRATGVQRIDQRIVRATFPPVSLKALGKRTIALEFDEGLRFELADGFEYVFDEDPIVFVHGYSGGAWHFEAMMARFHDAGYPWSALRALSFSDPFGSSLPNVQQLSAHVDRVLQETGADKVDMLVHSMGGISSRLYIGNGGGTKIRDYVAIAGANHGTLSAFLGPEEGADELRPPYACDGESRNNLQFLLNGCLTDNGRLAVANETPFGVEDGGGIAYLSLFSGQDEMIVPAESSCLNQQFKNDCTDPVNERVYLLGHGGILLEPHVADRALEHLRVRNRNKP